MAEGSGRGHTKEYLQFLHISRGSLSEVSYLLHLSKKLQYLSSVDFEELSQLVTVPAKTLHGLIMAINKEV